jgi:endonuclease-3
MTKKDYDEIFTKLLELFPNPDTELKFSTPFQLLVAVMLSAQTTDKQVNIVTDKLFIKVKEPNNILKMSEENLAKQISSVNYYKIKTKHIKESAQRLVELAKDKKTKLTKNEKECLNKYGYYLPESLE